MSDRKSIAGLAADYERKHYWSDGQGHLGFRNRGTGNIDWFKWDAKLGHYVRTSSILKSEGATSRKLEGA